MRRDSTDRATSKMSPCQDQGEALSPRGVLDGLGSFADSCNSSPSGSYTNQGGWSPQNCRKSLLSPISSSSDESRNSERQKPCLTLWKSMSMRRWNTFPASNQKAPKRSPSNFLAQRVLRLCQGPHPLTPSPSLDREQASAMLCSALTVKPHWRFFSAEELSAATGNFNPGEFLPQMVLRSMKDALCGGFSTLGPVSTSPEEEEDDRRNSRRVVSWQIISLAKGAMRMCTRESSQTGV